MAREPEKKTKKQSSGTVHIAAYQETEDHPPHPKDAKRDALPVKKGDAAATSRPEPPAKSVEEREQAKCEPAEQDGRGGA